MTLTYWRPKIIFECYLKDLYMLFHLQKNILFESLSVLGIPVLHVKCKRDYFKYYLFGICVFKKKFSKKIDFSFNSSNFKSIPLNNETLLAELSAIGPFTYMPNPGNLGDMLIAASTIQFFEDYKLPYKMFSDSQNLKTLVYGGGGIWIKNYETGWQNFLDLFSKAEKIVILPSSFYECDKFLKVLDKRFVVFCREKQSYDYLLKAGTKAKILLDHDMALRLNKKIFMPTTFYLIPTDIEILKRLKDFLQKPQANAYLLRQDCEKKFQHQTDLDLSSCGGGNFYSSKEHIRFCALVMLSLVDGLHKVVTDRLHVGIASILMGGGKEKGSLFNG